MATSLPEQARKALEDTEAYYKQQQEEVTDETEDTSESGETQEEGVAAEAESTTDAENESTDTSEDSTGTVSKDATSEQGNEQQTQQPSDAEELRQLRQRYSSLQGMFNSSDARLREALSQIDQLRGAISTLQQTAPQPQNGQQGTGQPVGVSEDEIKEYTPQFFNMLDRYTASKLAPVQTQLDSIGRLPDTVGQLSHQLQTVASAQTQGTEQMFFSELSKTHPDWETINNSAGFGNWLQVADPYTGITRQVYLDEARKRLDLEHVNNIFAGYKSTLKPTAGKDAQHNKSQNVEVQQQAVVTPRKAPKTKIKADPKQTYSKADLDQLYTDYRHGKYNNKEADFRALEVELLNAIQEGRYQ
jgi:hypothetical protein